MEILTYIIPIIAISLLCASWVLVQILAKKMKTKNHFDDLPDSCGHCEVNNKENCDITDCQKPVSENKTTLIS